jgi:hypothetical protein
MIFIEYQIWRMRNMIPDATLLTMIKALADENRLKLLRFLHTDEHSVGELARLIDLGEPTVSHHLAKLREAGLVTLRMAGNQRFYRVRQEGLAQLKTAIATIEQMPPQPESETRDESWIAALGWDVEDQYILRDHTRNGQITILPAKQRKLLVILRWVATHFEADRLYTEAEVNTLLKAVHAHDFVTLRRELINFGYLRRERGGGKYWLAPNEEQSSAASES